MKQWLIQRQAIPRWVILVIAVLTIVSFVTIYVKAHELDKEKQAAGIELWYERHPLGSINVLEIPPVGTLRYVEITIGFLCSLSVVIVAVWILLQHRTLDE
ncbi:MAG: hypothetical protein GY847_30910 [Proteobacteria bacterium]|nr:hypothetical protein [Pseudomonadota bacterium]